MQWRRPKGAAATGDANSSSGIAPMTGPSYRALFRNRSFAAFWLGQLVSQSGDGIFDIALLWLVLVTTNSPGLVGVTQAAVLAPGILVGPAAGVYADRLNRKSLIIVSNFFQGAVTAVISVLYLLGVLSFPPLILLVLLLYSGAEFYRAASGAMIPSMVPRENLGAANALFTLSTSANQAASYAIGGIALVTVGAAASVVYDSMTFFAAALIMTLILRTYGNPKTVGSEGAPSRPNFIEEFRMGLSYVRSNRLFRELIVLGILINFLGAGIGVVMVPFVKYQLNGSAFVYGAVSAASAVGLVLGSVLVGKINFRRYVGKLLFAGIIAVGLLIALLGLVSSITFALPVIFVIGAISGILNIPIQVLVQTQVPRELLGRAGTVLRALLGIAAPVSVIVFGVLAEVTSATFVFQVGGVSIVIATAILYFPFKELRNASY